MQKGLWVDKTFSFFVATLPDWLRYLSIDSTPPLYYVILRGWVGVAGASEFALRLLSTIGGTLSVVAAVWIGRRMFSPATGLCSGLFVAVAPLHVYYSQEARSYTLLVLLLFLMHAAYWRAFDRNTSATWITASLCEPGGVRLRWKTASEIDNVGFRVLRAGPGEEPVAVSTLIPTAGNELIGAEYEYFDAGLKRRGKVYTYYLQDLDNEGVSTVRGEPVAVVIQGRLRPVVAEAPRSGGR